MMSAELDQIDELAEQLHQAVQGCKHISDKDEKKVIDFLQWLHMRVWTARQEVDEDKAQAWGLTEEQVLHARFVGQEKH
jgi:hypothetical protein